MGDDNVHWLRDTYGPALRAFYAELLREPVPQKFKDLLTRLEAEALAGGKAPSDAAPMTRSATGQPADASE
jgi:hypothetical protein